jgi:hypothetical protein
VKIFFNFQFAGVRNSVRTHIIDVPIFYVCNSVAEFKEMNK